MGFQTSGVEEMSELAGTSQDEARPQATAHPNEGQSNEELHGKTRTYIQGAKETARKGAEELARNDHKENGQDINGGTDKKTTEAK